MKINVKEINLDFTPCIYDWDFREKNSNNCNAKLTIKFDNKLKDINVVVSNLTYKDAQEVYESSQEKGIALLNVRHNNKDISDFCRIKIDTFCDIKPKSNWNKYKVWADVIEEIKRLHRKAKKIEKLILKKQITDYDYKDVDFSEFLKKFHQPQTPTPIWVVDQNSQPYYNCGNSGKITYNNTLSSGEIVGYSTDV